MDKKWIAIIIIVIIAILACCAAYYSTSDNSNNEVVKVGYMPSDHSAALFVAYAQKTYQKNHIKVELYQFNNGGDIMTAMASGDIDIGYVGITPVLSSIEKGVPVKVVSSVQSEGSALVVGDKTGITDVTQLKGKQVATPGMSSIQHILLTYYLKQNNMKMEDLDVVSMKVPFMSNSLRAGQVDAIMTYEPYASIATTMGYGIELESSGDMVPNHPCCVMVAREDFIAKHPDTLELMVAIHENTTKFVIDHPVEAASLLPEDIVASSDIEKISLTKSKFTYGLSDEFKDAVSQFMKIEVSLGLLNSTIDDSRLYYK